MPATPDSQLRDQPPRFFYRKRHRVTSAEEFDAVFNHQIRKSRGPITVFIKPNTLPHHRLGLSIGKRAGNAVTRGRIKRMIRECFRLDQHNLPLSPSANPSATPSGFDIVVTARKHDPADLSEWRQWFLGATTAAIRVSLKHTQQPDAAIPRSSKDQHDD